MCRVCRHRNWEAPVFYSARRCCRLRSERCRAGKEAVTEAGIRLNLVEAEISVQTSVVASARAAEAGSVCETRALLKRA